MFMSKGRITGMTTSNWIVEVQEWPDGHWIGDTNGMAVLDKSHFIGTPRVGFEGTMTFDSFKLAFVVDDPKS